MRLPQTRSIATHSLIALLAVVATYWFTTSHNKLPHSLRQIISGDTTINYTGTANGTHTPDGQHWIGRIQGQVQATNPKTTVVTTDLTLGLDGSMIAVGPTRLTTTEQ